MSSLHQNKLMVTAKHSAALATFEGYNMSMNCKAENIRFLLWLYLCPFFYVIAYHTAQQ